MVNKTKLHAKSYDLGRLSESVSLVARGVRPAGAVTIRRTLLREAKEIVEKAGLRHESTPIEDPHVELFFFKHPHLRYIIREIALLSPDRGVFRDWCWGKLFGYSEEEIREFIGKIHPEKRGW